VNIWAEARKLFNMGIGAINQLYTAVTTAYKAVYIVCSFSNVERDIVTCGVVICGAILRGVQSIATRDC
jgi:hypothetical protein